MTTKVTDNQVLEAIGTIPTTYAEIGRKLNLHRSNVAPRVQRLAQAGLVQQVADRWVRADSTKSTTIPGTKMTPTQIAFAEKLLGVNDDYEIDDERIEIVASLIVEDLITNLSDMYEDDAMVEILRRLTVYSNDFKEEEEANVDELLSQLRQIITGESQQKPTIIGTILSPDQLAIVELLHGCYSYTLDAMEDELGLSVSTVTSAMKQLESAGWVFEMDGNNEWCLSAEAEDYMDTKPQQKPTISEVSDMAMAVFTMIRIKQRTERDICNLYNFKKNETRKLLVELQEAELIDEHIVPGDIYYTEKGKQVV